MIRIRCLPDLILNELPSPHARAALQLVLGHLANHPDYEPGFPEFMPPVPEQDCSKETLQNAIRGSLQRFSRATKKAEADEEMSLFSDLASLNNACFQIKGKPSIINLDMFRLAIEGYDSALVESLLEILEDEPKHGLRVITTAQYKQLLVENSDVPNDVKFSLKKEIKRRRKTETNM